MKEPKKRRSGGSVYDQIAGSLIEKLEAGGVPPWEVPWRKGLRGLPANLPSGRHYTGVNVLVMLDAVQRRGFASRYFMTFGQAKKAGGHVRRGERGTTVIGWFRPRRSDEHDSDEREVASANLMPRPFVVFSLDQVAGVVEPDEPWGHGRCDPGDHDIDEWIASTRVEIQHRGQAARYRVMADRIEIPRRSRFESRDAYYATLFHELGHATGAAHRLDRDQGGRFGDPRYAAEELVAEMFSAFACARFGVKGATQHAGYLEHWLGELKAEPRLLGKSATAAQQALDWVDREAGLHVAA